LTGPQWAGESVRAQHRDHIIEVLGKWTLQHTAAELMEIGQLMHFPWAKLASLPEVVANPQLAARGFFSGVTESGSGRSYLFPGAPVKMSGSPWQVNPAAPLAGDYNEEMYLRRIGLTRAEMAELARAGII
jgi:crotonobetainyl-CoA:carnitine CoA-transferase CaiB-like acyl-CoA transferase